MSTTTPRRPALVAAALSIVLGLVFTLLSVAVAPAAHAVEPPPPIDLESPVDVQSASPELECAGLEYLDKFEWNDNGTGAFDNDTAADSDPTATGYAYTSSTGVTVSYTVTEEDGKFEARTVAWSSTVDVLRVVVQAGGGASPEIIADLDPAKRSGSHTTTQGLSHITFCIGSQVQVTKVFTNTDGTFLAQQPDPAPSHLVEVFDGTDTTGDPIASAFPGATDADRSGVVDGDQYSVTEAAIDGYAEVACADEVRTEYGAASSGTDGPFTAPAAGTTAVHVVCNAAGTTSEPTPPVFSVDASCSDQNAPIVTVTITSNPDGVPVVVSINDAAGTAITATQTFPGTAGDVLTATYGETEKQATFRDDCAQEFVASTASFTVNSACQQGRPALIWDVDLDETADDPVGDLTLTVADADGELGQAVASESSTGSIRLPAAAEGEAVTVSWDFDGTTRAETLASGCGDEVLGVVLDRDPAPAAADVKDAQLPNAGVAAEALAAVGLLAMALGAALLVGDRRRVRRSA